MEAEIGRLNVQSQYFVFKQKHANFKFLFLWNWIYLFFGLFFSLRFSQDKDNLELIDSILELDSDYDYMRALWEEKQIYILKI